jgi:hypothetical protein
MKSKRDPAKVRSERLKDRRDYRGALIHRREVIDGKIEGVEAQIKALNEKKAA